MTNDGINSLTPFPFGKYKGRAIGEVIADRNYTEWLLAQTDFTLRNPALANYLRNGPAKEDSDTPAHNAMQIRYLDKTYCGHLLNHLYNTPQLLADAREQLAKAEAKMATINSNLERLKSELPEKRREIEALISDHGEANSNVWKARLENHKLDEKVAELERSAILFKDDELKLAAHSVALYEQHIADPATATGKVQFEHGNWDVLIGPFAIELKPVISEDYPAIIRKVLQRPPVRQCVVVITDRYTGTVATFEQVRQMFAASNIRLLLSSEFEPVPEWITGT